MIPPQSTKTRTPIIERNQPNSSVELCLYPDNEPIQIGDIGGLNFCFCFMALSGLPLLAASCLAYFSLALRCWGVWACTSSK